MNVAANLERSALFFPDNPALSQDGREITYSRLDEERGVSPTALSKRE